MILFKPHHVPLIHNGTKTVTRRIWEKRRAKPGIIHKAKTKMLSKDFFANILIIDVFRQRLGDMTEEDARAEGGYTLESYREEFVKINGFWNPDLVVFVVKFKRVEAAPNSSGDLRNVPSARNPKTSPLEGGSLAVPNLSRGSRRLTISRFRAFHIKGGRIGFLLRHPKLKWGFGNYAVQ